MLCLLFVGRGDLSSYMYISSLVCVLFSQSALQVLFILIRKSSSSYLNIYSVYGRFILNPVNNVCMKYGRHLRGTFVFVIPWKGFTCLGEGQYRNCYLLLPRNTGYLQSCKPYRTWLFFFCCKLQ